MSTHPTRCLLMLVALLSVLAAGEASAIGLTARPTVTRTSSTVHEPSGAISTTVMLFGWSSLNEYARGVPL